MAHEFLATYLNDHLAGSEVALEIVDALRRMDNPAVWSELEHEIQTDRQELEQLMRSINSPPSKLKRATAWTAEKLAELRMRIDDSSVNGDLRRLELIEALALGIDGKQALWTALRVASERTPKLSALDYRHLIARAEAQRGVVEVRRLQAAAEALGPAVKSAP